MQFNTGNPNLVGLSRLLAGQLSDSVATVFAAQDVKDAVNIAYEELWDIGKRAAVGWGRKQTTQNATKDTVFYTLPTDYDGRIYDIEVEEDGKDLSSDTTADPTFLIPSEPQVALRDYREGGLTDVKYYFLEVNDTASRYGIVAPPPTTGTNAIRLTYEAELTHLSADADEPLVPKSQRAILAYFAAITLRISRDLDTSDLRFEVARKFPLFAEALGEPVLDLEHQASAAGRNARSFATSSGFIVRT